MSACLPIGRFISLCSILSPKIYKDFFDQRLSQFSWLVFFNFLAKPKEIILHKEYSTAIITNTHFIVAKIVVSIALVLEGWFNNVASIPMFSPISNTPATRDPLAIKNPILLLFNLAIFLQLYNKKSAQKNRNQKIPIGIIFCSSNNIYAVNACPGV